MSYYENRIKQLEARIEQMERGNRLKAIPVEAQLIDRIAELNKENARLKAEVEQLMVFCNCTLIPSKELQAKVERLTKAGDNVVADLEYLTKSGWFNNCKSVKRWNVAKEGKQP